MKKVQYTAGGRTIELKESKDLVAVRTHTDQSLQKSFATKASKQLSQKFRVKAKMNRANITVLKVKQDVAEPLKARNKAREVFKKEKDVRFAGRVLVDAVSEEPVLYTENIYIKFNPAASMEQCRKILDQHKLTIKTMVPSDERSFFVEAPEGTGMKIFSLCKRLSSKKEVDICEPEVVRKKGKKFKLPKAPVIHPRQWHLGKTLYRKKEINAHSNVASAHALTLGEGTTIAVIDDGVDITHPEFNIPGKIHAPMNVDDRSDDCMPYYKDDDHGTACAGVACASGQKSASGVAPAARLIPIRNESDLGSMDEAFCIYHAVENGADIISCSWGPEDGDPENDKDPLHFQAHELPQHMRDAIRFAVTKGRGGKGCIVLFSAGNGNEDADQDAYIANPDIIAVAACNDRGQKTIYSDFGKCIHVCFPSNDWEGTDHPAPFTTGIWTTDRIRKKGYSHNGYTFDFGGTSSACPGVAGVCALILSVNPELSARKVKEILKVTADKIDRKHGRYDAKGHSIYYGYGRVNAARAVAMAKKLRQAERKIVTKFVSLRPGTVFT